AATGLGIIAERVTARAPIARRAVAEVATRVVLGGRRLERDAAAVRGLWGHEDPPGARRRRRSRGGRGTSGTAADGASRAVGESWAGNTADAVVAPLLWGAVAGVPGLLAHRAVNTLDAMVGHRSARYERFGWASARLDDLLNLLGARLAAALTAACAPGRAGSVLYTWWRDAGAHPSPN